MFVCLEFWQKKSLSFVKNVPLPPTWMLNGFYYMYGTYWTGIPRSLIVSECIFAKATSTNMYLGIMCMYVLCVQLFAIWHAYIHTYWLTYYVPHRAKSLYWWYCSRNNIYLNMYYWWRSSLIQLIFSYCIIQRALISCKGAFTYDVRYW